MADNENALPKRARLDLLTQLTLEMLVKQHEAPHLVDAVLSDIEQDTDLAFLRDLKIGGFSD